ncbi:hypothetical protein D3C73_1290580 [compost metagenome]
MRMRPIVIADGKTAFYRAFRLTGTCRPLLLLHRTGVAQFTVTLQREGRHGATDVVRYQQITAIGCRIKINRPCAL